MTLQVLLLLEDVSTGGVSTIAGTLRDGLVGEGWRVAAAPVRGARWMALLAAARHCDVILAAHNFLPAYAAWVLGRTLRKPVVVWFHGPLAEVLLQARASATKRRWLAWLYRRLPSLVFVSEASRRSFDTFLDRPANAAGVSTVIPNAVPSQPFAQPDRSADQVELAYVGRLSAEKDPLLLLDVLRLLPAQYRLTMLGDGPLRTDISRAGADLVAAGRLVLAGARPFGPGLYRPWHLTVLASRYEGCPMSLLESFAFGVPCAAVPIDAVTELLKDAAPTQLAHERSAAGLAEAVRRVAQAPRAQLQSEMARVLERHRPADFLRRWQQVLVQAARQRC